VSIEAQHGASNTGCPYFFSFIINDKALQILSHPSS